MRILIVEDDTALGPALRTGLRQDGYAADWVRSADAAEQALRLEHFDLVVLDLGLPGRDGLAVLRDLRRGGFAAPVLILTARATVPDRVLGLDAGADDYMVKPFDLVELSARIRALIRRSQGHAGSILRVGDLVLDPATRQVTQGGRPLSLSPREYALLEVFLASADQALPRGRLLAAAYDWQDNVESNALEVHIHNLRRKLGKDRIVTVRGVGYRLVAGEGP